MPIFADFTSIAAEIHAENLAKGWWDAHRDDKYGRHEQNMMLITSELAEAMEGDRKQLQDDHLPERPMFFVELADTLIRLFDVAGAYEMQLRFDYEKVVAMQGFLTEGEGTVPVQLWRAVKLMASPGPEEYQVRVGITATLALANLHGVPLMKIVEEKRAYNRNRADHKRENQAKAGGKAY